MNQIFTPSILSEIESKSATLRDQLTFADAINLSVFDRITDMEEDWKQAEFESQISVYQRYEWCKSFLESEVICKDVQPFIVVGRYEGEIVFILPMAIHGTFIKRLKFIGGSHVNFNLGIFPTKYAKLVSSKSITRIFARIQKMVPGVGYVSLCCLPETWQQDTNPLIGLKHQRSANPAFVLNLEGGFEATLARGNGKRKQKKFRQQCRMAADLGGYEFIKPTSAKEVIEIIDLFFIQKSQRLSDLGISDVFRGPAIRKFLTDIAIRSFDEDEPLLQLYALKIKGEIIAVFGGGMLGKRISGYFSSIDIRQYQSLSPGEMLLYLVVEDACKQGYTQIDLGAGDERYKRSWSSEEITMYDVVLPFNSLGLPVLWMRLGYGALRRKFREDPKLWERYKKLRKLRSYFLPRSS